MQLGFGADGAPKVSNLENQNQNHRSQNSRSILSQNNGDLLSQSNRDTLSQSSHSPRDSSSLCVERLGTGSHHLFHIRGSMWWQDAASYTRLGAKQFVRHEWLKPVRFAGFASSISYATNKVGRF